MMIYVLPLWKSFALRDATVLLQQQHRMNTGFLFDNAVPLESTGKSTPTTGTRRESHLFDLQTAPSWRRSLPGLRVNLRNSAESYDFLALGSSFDAPNLDADWAIHSVYLWWRFRVSSPSAGISRRDRGTVL